MPAHEEVAHAMAALDMYSVHWYAVVGIALGVVAGLVGLSAAGYRLYNRSWSSVSQEDEYGETSQLSSAIKKGIKQAAGSIRRATSGDRITNLLKSPDDLEGGLPPDGGGGSNISKSPSLGSAGSGPVESPTSENGSENEKGAMSPQEKDETMRETAVDDLKLEKLGSLAFSVDYDRQKTALLVTVVRATDLPIKDPNVGSSDPYVKLQLLPEKRHKVKTRVLRKTLSPVYDEIFTFYGIHANQIAGITLHFVVLSFDRFSRDDVIGEVVYPLADVNVEEKEVTICKEIQPRQIKLASSGRGEVLVSLCYQPAANRLTVVVLKARNLPKMDITGLADPYVKIYLLYNGQRIAKKKTHVKKRTLNPVFNESFLFDVPCNEGLHNISLELVLLDWDRMTKNDTIGRLEIGAKMTDNEGNHWNEVMNCPRKQIAEWHKLKE